MKLIPIKTRFTNVQGFFTERQGSDGKNAGFSAEFDSGFNVGFNVGDQLLANRNREQLCQHVGQPVQWLNQVHGTSVVVNPVDESERPIADAAVTAKPGVALAVLTADCLPIVLANSAMVGVVHAGWRGLVNGVVEACLAQFSAAGIRGADISAVIGPAIGPTAFEVGEDVREAFMQAANSAELAATDECFAALQNRKYLADLGQLARIRLARANVTDALGPLACTYTEPSRFFSHRHYSQVAGGVKQLQSDHPQVQQGRQAALVWLTRE